MKFLKYFLLGLLFITSKNISANDFPLQISEIFSKNQITDYKGQKLILLDFWATWCGTCRPATKQLEYLQEQLPKDIFIVSVTDETHEAVGRYMKRIPIKLMVVRDFENNLIEKYNITRRPQAVLLNTDGEIMWEGHPADLRYRKVKRMAKRNKKAAEISLEDIFHSNKQPIIIKNETITDDTPKAEPKSSNDIVAFLERSFETTPTFEYSESRVKYIGSLFNLLAKAYNIPNHLVTSESIEDFFIKLEVSKHIWDTEPEKIINLVKKNLPIIITSKNKVEDVYILELTEKNKLWGNSKIDLGNNRVLNYTINENRIKADNMSIADFALLLSNTRQKVFLFLGYDDFKLHDWDLHFAFDDVMEEELLNKYGIRIKKSKINVEAIDISL